MHLTDDQLNEYLDHESAERTEIESHLSSCDECARRLAALERLFSEIESLPDVQLTSPIVVPIPSASPLPRWLSLTAILQVAFALLTVILAAPFITNLLSAIQLQLQWRTWLVGLSTFQLPTLPRMPTLETSSLMLLSTLVVASILWLVGNGLLLRRQLK